VSIRQELEALIDESEDGVLHARDVVQWAKSHPGSALHGAIEWDDIKAADAHRLWQARQLIQISLVREDGAPRMVSLTIDRASGGGYRQISDVLPVKSLRDQMLADALADHERWEQKYTDIRELVDIHEAARQARSALRRRKPKGGEEGARPSA
jgi:hypothetical protein